ncbi:vesicle-associated protein [Salix suchowensis]|nr:vesicle-associated protein [Salix suchowensis]
MVFKAMSAAMPNNHSTTHFLDINPMPELKLAQDDELKQDKDAVSNEHSKLAQDMESNSLNKEIITANAVDSKLASDINEMKSILHVAESKPSETKSSISKLAEEKRQSCQEMKILQEELDFLDEAQILELKMMSRERGDEPSTFTKKLEENQNESFRTEILTQQQPMLSKERCENWELWGPTNFMNVTMT